MDRHYAGSAKVHISHLVFEDNSLIDNEEFETRVPRLLKVFRKEGCARQGPEHHVKLVLEEQVPTKAIEESGNPIINDFLRIELTKLHFAQGEELLCFDGRIRIVAAKEYLELDDQW